MKKCVGVIRRRRTHFSGYRVNQDYQDGIFAGASNLIEVVTGTPAQSVEDFATANPAAFDRR